MSQDIIIFGIGGHAKVVFDIIKKDGKFRPVAFYSLESATDFLGLPNRHQDTFEKEVIQYGVVAIGDNWVRSKVVNFILSKNKNFKFVTLVHPSAQIGMDVKIGVGTVVMANTAINSGTVIGDHSIINTTSSVDHDCHIGHFATIAPGAVLGGNVTVGDFSVVSLGAKIIHGIKIGTQTVVGAGAVVLKNLEDFIVAYGAPAKKSRERRAGEKYL